MKKSIFVLISILLIGSIIFYAYSNYINGHIVGMIQDDDSSLQFNEAMYYPVYNAEHIDEDDFLGYLTNRRNRIEVFDSKEKLYQVTDEEPMDYLLYTLHAEMELIRVLHVANHVKTIPITFFDQLPYESIDDITYHGQSFHQYLAVEENITQQLRILDEDATLVYYAFESIPSHQWLVVYNKEANTYHAFFTEFDQLDAVPAAIYVYHQPDTL
ncbi:hypothetical protein [Enterococcus sp. N249-2]